MGVIGIGGLFFRARDPDALSAWYREHLGIGAGCAAEGAGEANEWAWTAQGGPIVFTSFAADTDYFPSAKAFMMNFRVSDLPGLLGTLADAGIPLETRAEWDDPAIGRFACVHDPEGNPIELWEPPAS